MNIKKEYIKPEILLEELEYDSALCLISGYGPDQGDGGGPGRPQTRASIVAALNLYIDELEELEAEEENNNSIFSEEWI